MPEIKRHQLNWIEHGFSIPMVVGSNPTWRAKIQENKVLQFLLCLFGLHGATEIDYTVDDEEIKVCRDCLKEID